MEYPGSLEADVLTVQLQGSAREPERLLLIGRPRERPTGVERRAGAPSSIVRVREWSTGAWSAPPVERDVDSAELFAEIERAFRANRRVGQELYRVRRWLLGPGLRAR